MLVRDSKIVSKWLETHRHQLRSDVTEPCVVTTSQEDIEAFLDRQLSQGCGYEDIRDHTVFDFHDEEDLVLFMREVMSADHRVKINFTLHRADYLAENVFFNCNF